MIWVKPANAGLAVLLGLRHGRAAGILDGPNSAWKVTPVNQRRFDAVIFDFGGVITASPFEAFNRLEAERGLPRDFIRRVNAANPDSNAWALFERAEIDAATFDMRFAAEAQALGHDLDGAAVLAVLSGAIRPAMVTALDRLKDAGYRLGCITNNVPAGHGAGMARSGDGADAYEQVFARFEVVIESSKAGVRKPDPRIYLMMCDAMGLTPQACVYLDDLGINCKPSAALGMHAIKVNSGQQALADLSAALDLALTD
ncbi:MAG: HAD-IA family hydrolase [Proteobacteria bacterium]|nr:HAD-IA family hydrolase [Pseudomonadota bacterium]